MLSRFQSKDEGPTLEQEVTRLLMPLPQLAQQQAPPAAARGAARGSASEDGGAALLEAVTAGGAPVLAAAAPEPQQQAAAQRMQRLLVLGRKADALKVLQQRTMGLTSSARTVVLSTPHAYSCIVVVHLSADMFRCSLRGHRGLDPQVAVEAGLWGPALLLSTAVTADGRAFQETAAAMAQALLLPGTPARTVALLLAGRPDLVQFEQLPQHQPQAQQQQEQNATPPVPFGAGGGGGGGGSFSSTRSPYMPSAPTTPTGAPPAGFFNPAAPLGARISATGCSAAAASALVSWHEQLAVLLGTRGPADASEAVVRLGDRLRVDGGQVGGGGGGRTGMWTAEGVCHRG